MKIERILDRNDGSKVKIVAELFVSVSGFKSISNYVLSAKALSTNWMLHTDSRIPREFIGVNDYLANGRPHMLRVVSVSEVLKLNQELLMLAY